MELRQAGAAALGVALAAALLALTAAPASAQEAESPSQAVRPGATLTRPSSPTLPPRDHFLNAVQAARIAARDPKLREELRKHEDVRRETFAKGPGRWQVSWFDDGDEIAQVIVDEREGRAIEVWTGPQVAWQMARGVDGAFGRKVNAPWVWIPLMLAFFVPFFDPRRPLRLVHLDLLVLLSFSVSHVFFNRGEIFTSVPLVYPVLAYLLVRMLMLARAHGASRDGEPRGVPFLLVPATWLVLGLIFLVGFRVGLNVTNANVIDVGLLRSDRCRSDHRRRGPLRQLPGGQPLGRHVRAGQLLRLRAVRGGVPVVGHVGRPARRACRRAGLRPAHDARAVLRRPHAAKGS